MEGYPGPLTAYLHTSHQCWNFRTNLWGLGTEQEEGFRTGPLGYTAWWNWFLGIDSWAFKNTCLEDSSPGAFFRPVTHNFWGYIQHGGIGSCASHLLRYRRQETEVHGGIGSGIFLYVYYFSMARMYSHTSPSTTSRRHHLDDETTTFGYCK
jgi:hypothetical protein